MSARDVNDGDDQQLLNNTGCGGMKVMIRRVFGSCLGYLYSKPDTENDQTVEWVLIDVVDRQPSTTGDFVNTMNTNSDRSEEGQSLITNGPETTEHVPL